MKYNGTIRGNRLEHRAEWMDLKAEFWVKKKSNQQDGKYNIAIYVKSKQPHTTNNTHASYRNPMYCSESRECKLFGRFKKASKIKTRGV